MITPSLSTLRNSNQLIDEISGRKFPGFGLQLLVLLRRGAVKYLRSFWPLKVIDILLLIFAAFIIGESRAHGYCHTHGYNISHQQNVVCLMWTSIPNSTMDYG